MKVDIKWYVPDELIGKELTFKLGQRYIVYGNPAGSKTSVVKFNGKESNVFAPPLPEANLLTGEIADNPGNLLVKYAYDGTITQPDVTVRHWLDDSIDQKVTDDTNVDPAGFDRKSTRLNSSH